MSRSRIAITVVVGLLLLTFVAERATSSPALCGGCHSMEAKAAAWAESSHAQVTCVTCHTTPRPWYAAPVSIAERSILIGRDVYRHVALGVRPAKAQPAADPGDAATDFGEKRMEDGICLHCHDPNRPATSGFRIKIDHAEHARRNGSCVSCHHLTAHPIPSRGMPMSLMTQCFTCHGTAEQPEASAECGTCHPDGYQLEPASHEPERWMTDHGRTVDADSGQCAMCHSQRFCTDCHGLEMPHPAGWAQGGADKGHAEHGTRDRALCARCHDDKPDLCSMCHHKELDPAKGSWVKQHFAEVSKTGVSYCFECHSPAYCVRCHVGRRE